MSKAVEVPARKKRQVDDDFHYVRMQRLPESVTSGYDPLYAMDEQADRFCTIGTEYVKDEDRSGKAFDVFKIPKEEYAKIERGLQKEANDRLVRPEDTKIKSTTGSGNVAPDDKITQDSQTLDQIGSALPNSV